jgi:hypothetical protein
MAVPTWVATEVATVLLARRSGIEWPMGPYSGPHVAEAPIPGGRYWYNPVYMSDRMLEDYRPNRARKLEWFLEHGFTVYTQCGLRRVGRGYQAEWAQIRNVSDAGDSWQYYVLPPEPLRSDKRNHRVVRARYWLKKIAILNLERCVMKVCRGRMRDRRAALDRLSRIITYRKNAGGYIPEALKGGGDIEIR